MTPGTWLLLLAGVLLLVHLGWTVWTATRLRRLEGRVRRSWEVLDGALLRRAELAAALARERAAELGDVAPELAENALGRELRDLGDALPCVPAALGADLEGTATRIGLARRFYNDAVRDTRTLRAQRLARVQRLHARRPLPRYFDIDDGQDAVVAGSAAGAGRAGG